VGRTWATLFVLLNGWFTTTLVVAVSAAAQSPQIVTVAGNGILADLGDGSQSQQASVHTPSALTVLSGTGDLVLATGESRLRLISALSGEITTIAGTGNPGSGGDWGPATSADLLNMYGLYASPDNRIYIPIWQGNCVRVLDRTSGIIAPFAGVGYAANIHSNGDGGVATSAHFTSPTDVSLDAAGNVFISDYVSNNVRMVNNTNGLISTVAGNTNGLAGEIASRVCCTYLHS
jgi:hypothetical protein